MKKIILIYVSLVLSACGSNSNISLNEALTQPTYPNDTNSCHFTTNIVGPTLTHRLVIPPANNPIDILIVIDGRVSSTHIQEIAVLLPGWIRDMRSKLSQFNIGFTDASGVLKGPTPIISSSDTNADSQAEVNLLTIAASNPAALINPVQTIFDTFTHTQFYRPGAHEVFIVIAEDRGLNQKWTGAEINSRIKTFDAHVGNANWTFNVQNYGAPDSDFNHSYQFCTETDGKNYFYQNHLNNLAGLSNLSGGYYYGPMQYNSSFFDYCTDEMENISRDINLRSLTDDPASAETILLDGSQIQAFVNGFPINFYRDLYNWKIRLTDSNPYLTATPIELTLTPHYTTKESITP